MLAPPAYDSFNCFQRAYFKVIEYSFYLLNTCAIPFVFSIFLSITFKKFSRRILLFFTSALRLFFIDRFVFTCSTVKIFSICVLYVCILYIQILIIEFPLTKISCTIRYPKKLTKVCQNIFSKKKILTNPRLSFVLSKSFFFFAC